MHGQADREVCLEIAQPEFEETSRFPNVEFLETDDPTVYFDRRGTSPPIISPVEAYLELSNGGKREQEAAAPLRTNLLTREYEK